MQQSSALVAERRDALKDNPPAEKGSDTMQELDLLCWFAYPFVLYCDYFLYVYYDVLGSEEDV